MKLNNLKPAKGATHNSKRLGRGQGSGEGGTSTRGTKGAQALAGYEHKMLRRRSDAYPEDPPQVRFQEPYKN